MNRTEKTAIFEALGKDLAQSSNAFLFDFTGLKVPQVTELRRQVRGTQSEYLVVKNTLALRATEGHALWRRCAEHFRGATAVAYNRSTRGAGQGADELRQDEPQPGVQGGRDRGSGRAGDRDQDHRRAAVPRGARRRSSCTSCSRRCARLVTVLNGPSATWRSSLSQIAEQKSKSGPADAAPAN